MIHAIARMIGDFYAHVRRWSTDFVTDGSELPRAFSTRLLIRLVDYRITQTKTVDLIAAQSRSIVTIVYYGQWQKAVYLFGKRIWSIKEEKC